MKDAGRKLFFRYVRFKDGGGPRTDKISSKEDGGGQGTNPFRPSQGRIRTEDLSKFLKSGRRRTKESFSSASRTDLDEGRSKFQNADSVSPKRLS